MADDPRFVSKGPKSNRFDARWRALARRRYRRLAVIIYLVILSIGVALGTLVHWQGQQVLDVTGNLIAKDMRSQQLIADLEANAIRLEPVLYEYYATEDSAKFRLAYRHLRTEIANQIEMLAPRFPDRNEIQQIPRIMNGVHRIAARLDRNLASSDTDWDLAREALAGISEDLSTVRRALGQLVESIREQVTERSTRTHDLVNETVVMALAFATVTFVTILVIGYFVTSALTTGLHRRWLTTFLERNANPILSISDDGEILYANPSAAEIVGTAETMPDVQQTLLPKDAMHRLEDMRRNGSRYQRWEYAIGDRIFGCGVHQLRDLAVFHLYISDITKRKHDELQLERAAYHDPLTGLPNRRRFAEDLQTALVANSGGTVLAISIDRFRELVEGVGHDISDAVLTAFGRSLDASLQSASRGEPPIRLYHFGGDHFTVLADNPAITEQAALSLADRLIQLCKKPLSAADRSFFVSTSIGVKHYPPGGTEDWTTILKHAESALQQAHREGGGTVRQFTSDLEGEALRRLELEHALRCAVDAQELHLEFQPQLDVHSQAILGVEALVRWNHPDLGAISPVHFIPLAEETGIIEELGRWVLLEACRQTERLHRLGFPDLTVAVNVSPRQIADPRFPETVADTLEATGLPGSALHLEVTETAAMHNPELAIQALNAIRQLGAKIAIDDFGTGYSSLAYLHTLPINKLKIDRSFIRAMGQDNDDIAIVAATIELAHKLGLTVTAEGVETEKQLNRLVALGCEEIQGFLIARPMKPKALGEFLAEHSGEAPLAQRAADR